MSSERHLRRALEALTDAAREHLARHPQGPSLLEGSGTELEIQLSVPVRRGRTKDEAVKTAHQELVGALEAELGRRSAFRPGRIWCLRCSASDCEHSAPANSREIFAGYGSSGAPRFLDFGQWLLERKHPHLDRLYSKPPALVTEVVSGRELNGALVPAFRDRRNDHRVHGQVVAGWYPVRRSGPGTGSLALTLQVLSSAVRKGRRRGQRQMALNVLAAGPDGEPLEELYDRFEQVPWKSVSHWCQSVLRSIERSQGRKSARPEQLSGRIEGLLQSIARRLEQERRSRGRRTRHAQKRHTGGDRPTRMALRDLARVGDDHVLVDERRQTLVVLGDRGRAHVWNDQGKLVTSIRYSTESIERKKKRNVWRPARRDEILGLRKTVGVEPRPGAGVSGKLPPATDSG